MIAERMTAGAAAFGSLVSNHALHRIRLIGPLATISFGFIGASSVQLLAVPAVCPLIAAIPAQKGCSSTPSLAPMAGSGAHLPTLYSFCCVCSIAGAANTRLPVAA